MREFFAAKKCSFPCRTEPELWYASLMGLPCNRVHIFAAVCIYAEIQLNVATEDGLYVSHVSHTPPLVRIGHV